MMLGFQNSHQLILNLSQVTSALSSGSVRVTSTSVKQKPEIDIYCSESFLNSLKGFQQSENLELFSNLPNVKFGPRFEDIQWICGKDFNFKLTAQKSVKEDDFYVSFDKKVLKSFSSDKNVLKFFEWKKERGCGGRQKKILEKAQSFTVNKSTWAETYVSQNSFDQNKKFSNGVVNRRQGDFTKINPIFSSLAGILNSTSCSPSVISVHKRNFKTRRAVALEEDRASSGFFTKLGKDLGIQGSVAGYDVKEKDSPTLTKMMADESLSPEDKLKLKVSFAEGYMVASNDLKKRLGMGVWYKPFVVLKSVILMAVLLALVGGLFFDGRRTIFSFDFRHHGEINPEDVGVTFSDVKGVEEVKEELQEIVEFLKNPNKFSNMGGKLPKGVLLVGPPGTGKTLLAKAVAGEANVSFFQASGSEFDEIFVGEGARRVRNLFRSAKAKSPSIIFIDEIDCVGSKRKGTMLHPYANQTINQLLSEMDGFAKNEGVIVLGATNRKGDLDPALLRPGRFDVEVVIPLPDLDGRRQILELYISKIVSKDIDIGKIAKATAGCTGADLEAMVNHAAIRAATEGAPYVTMEYLENAKDKILMGPERKSAMKSDEGNLMTAYHEGGHTVVAYFTEGVGLVDKVTIVPRGNSLGHTSVVPETDDRHITKALCLARMDILLGGRAAEELIFGTNKITANASDDLDKATAIASSMVKDFGMSDKVGLRTLKSSEGELVSVNQFGQVVTDQVDMEVKRLIQESYERAKSVLKKHAKEHKLLAEALIKYKTLSPEDVRAILGDNATDKSSTTASAAN